VHEFIFHFNVFNGDTANMVRTYIALPLTGYAVMFIAECAPVCLFLQEKIQLFFQRLKHFTLRESKEWKVRTIDDTYAGSVCH
jgi:hypothetical protein